MMHELGGGGFSVRPLSQFPAPVTGTTTGPAVSDDSAFSFVEIEPLFFAESFLC
jgi:hypothetical protein